MMISTCPASEEWNSGWFENRNSEGSEKSHEGWRPQQRLMEFLWKVVRKFINQAQHTHVNKPRNHCECGMSARFEMQSSHEDFYSAFFRQRLGKL